MPARSVVEMATIGGARALGMGDRIGSLAVGKRADIALWDVSGLETAGSWDPAALLLAGPVRVRDLVVEGRMVVRDGEIVTFDLRQAILKQNRLAKALADSM